MPVDTEQQKSQTQQTQQGGPSDHLQDPLANRTGLPDQLKSGIENLSGYSMDDVKVHYNSPKPAQLQAQAYAQGSQIHLGPGQDQHLPHEAWHVVQQKQGRVQGTQMKGGEGGSLEQEADTMGAKAMSAGSLGAAAGPLQQSSASGPKQFKKGTSRGSNPRTFVLPSSVKDHIFVNSGNGSGFHSVARNKGSLTEYVQQTDNVDRDSKPYRAKHLKNDKRSVAAEGKSMFPDGWNEGKVVETIQRALTRNDIKDSEQVRINQDGNTEDNNRPLPDIDNGKVHGKANGVRVEGITSGGKLETVYPLV